MTGDGTGRLLSLATRRELTNAIAARYQAAVRADKRKILDEFIEVTSFHRKHAIRVLRKVPKEADPDPAARKSRVYDEAVRQTLTVLWEAADRCAGSG